MCVADVVAEREDEIDEKRRQQQPGPAPSRPDELPETAKREKRSGPAELLAEVEGIHA